jgi:hypothetical protein
VNSSSAGDPRLFDFNVAGQQLRPYIKNALQDAVLRLPGRVVTFLRGRVRPDQIMGMRDSYVNAFLIQSRGTASETPCGACQDKMVLDPNGYASPFPTCVRLAGHFGGSCGNCKWRDHAARCSRGDNPGSTRRQGRSGQRVRRRGQGRNQARGGGQRQLALGSEGNPISLDDDEDDEYDFEVDGSGDFVYEGLSEEDEGDDDDGTSSRPVRLIGN